MSGAELALILTGATLGAAFLFLAGVAFTLWLVFRNWRIW